ncbi:MAG TPA: hypothetical protein VK629_10280 [Steroidobacteraceae bacterium]|nr:hypothetical protein [Steroidobacteraceae bacterium]
MKPRSKILCTMGMLLASVVSAGPLSAEVASRDLVRECIATDDSLYTRKMRIDENANADERALAEAQDASSRLNAMKGELNTADVAAVDAFNQKLNAQNVAAAELNGAIDAHAKEVDAYNRDVQAYNQKCASVKMRKHDRRQVIKERAQEEAKAKQN